MSGALQQQEENESVHGETRSKNFKYLTRWTPAPSGQARIILKAFFPTFGMGYNGFAGLTAYALSYTWSNDQMGIFFIAFIFYATFAASFAVGFVVAQLVCLTRYADLVDEDRQYREQHPAKYSMWYDDGTQHWYFYHIATQATRWDMPEDFIFVRSAPGKYWHEHHGLSWLLDSQHCRTFAATLYPAWSLLICGIMTTATFAPIGAQKFSFIGDGGMAFLKFSEAALFAATCPMMDTSKSGWGVLNKAQSLSLLSMSIALGMPSLGSQASQSFFSNFATVVVPIAMGLDAIFGKRFGVQRDPLDMPWPTLVESNDEAGESLGQHGQDGLASAGDAMGTGLMMGAPAGGMSDWAGGLDVGGFIRRA